MRLTELDPRWIRAGEGRTGMGVAFECPVHGGRCGMLGVWFVNPIDGGSPAEPSIEPTFRWQRTGDTFDTLTLTPSVDASQNKYHDTPCWHGFITNGEIA